MPTVRLGARFRQGAAPDSRLDIVAADRFLLRTPGSGWPGDGHGGPLDRPVGRTPRFKVTAEPMGPDPVRTAAATRRTPPAPSVRPCVWPAGHGQPRGLHVLALTGRDGNAHARFGQPQPLPASGPVRRDHLHPCSMPERPQAWSPSDVRAVVSGVQDGRHDRTGFRTPHVRSIRPDTVHSTRHAMANRKRRGQGTDERHGRTRTSAASCTSARQPLRPTSSASSASSGSTTAPPRSPSPWNAASSASPGDHPTSCRVPVWLGVPPTPGVLILPMDNSATNGSDVTVSTDGQDWRVAWHPPPSPPQGTPHGAAAVCVAGDRGRVGKQRRSAVGPSWWPPEQQCLAGRRTPAT
jgi:hypothetical protein